MKQISRFTLTLAALCAALQLSATTRTVNNSSPSPGQFSSIQAAIDASSAGDTILVTNTPFNYGNFTINKNNLVLLGAGHYPQKTPVYSSYVNDINWGGGVNGCKIQGFNLSVFNAQSDVDNITIEFCLVRNTISMWYDNDNWTVKNCVFTCQDCCAMNANSTPDRSNLLIAFNVFNAGSGLCNFSNGNSGILITNNIFLKGTASDNGACVQVYEALLTNNIFYESSAGVYGNCIFNNNLTYSASDNSLPPASCGTCSGAGNIINQNPLFTTYANGQNFDYNHDYILQAGSPGAGAGTDGTDLGVYGTGNTFSETGEPPLPVVRVLTIANPNAAAGTNLNVTVEASNPDPDQN